ncbi:MAG TPA: TonB-dependent receptor [Brevundimonas sp.]|uniref:TonB-dependent receptor domain-containing protein n=1 Tax=Brevundimonas sp. TaxID=1871086 RepID=UPI002ED841F6
MVGTALSMPAGVALAQTATPPAQPRPPAQAPAQPAPQTPADEPARVGDVVVSGRASDVRSSIDSTSYSLANDLQAANGTLAEALRNVPSVEVDPDGNVSLRGDANVTILVDGRPSAVLSGPNRGTAVLQLPADRYARIEVMTNPSAAYSPEGSGGVINLITKPVPAGASATPQGTQTTGSVRLNVGPDGRWNGGLSGSWQKDKLTLTGDLNARRDAFDIEFDTLREQLDPVSGAVVSTTTTTSDGFDTANEGAFGRVSAEYNLTSRTQLTAELRGARFQGESGGRTLFETRDAAGVVTRAFERDSQAEFEGLNYGVTGRVLHRFDDAGHEWSNELRIDRGSNENQSRTDTVFTTPAGAPQYQDTLGESDFTVIGVTSAYVRPMGEAKLRAGYELEIRRPEQSNRYRSGPSEGAAVIDPAFTNRFAAEQTVHALYATYERPFTEKLSAQFGLRLEQANIDLDQITTGVQASQDYFRAYPTTHLSYQLTESQLLRASYSRRIQRPQPFQLNPFVSYQDPLNLRSGNPDLEPQETDSFEAMWQLRSGPTFYQATAYYRDTQKAFTDVARDIGGGVFLTRPENVGARRDAGVELVASGALHPTLRYNASVNLFRQEIDASGIPGAVDREADLVSGRINLNWTPTPRDFLQVSAFWQGEQLLAQGTRDSGGMVNLGYRRKLNDKLSLNVTVRDVFDTFQNVTTYDTPLFRERSEQKIGLRAAFIGLTYTFGSSPRRQPEQFDFSTGQTGG